MSSARNACEAIRPAGPAIGAGVCRRPGPQTDRDLVGEQAALAGEDGALGAAHDEVLERRVLGQGGLRDPVARPQGELQGFEFARRGAEVFGRGDRRDAGGDPAM